MVSVKASLNSVQGNEKRPAVPVPLSESTNYHKEAGITLGIGRKAP